MLLPRPPGTARALPAARCRVRPSRRTGRGGRGRGLSPSPPRPQARPSSPLAPLARPLGKAGFSLVSGAVAQGPAPPSPCPVRERAAGGGGEPAPSLRCRLRALPLRTRARSGRSNFPTFPYISLNFPIKVLREAVSAIPGLAATHTAVGSLSSLPALRWAQRAGAAQAHSQGAARPRPAEFGVIVLNPSPNAHLTSTLVHLSTASRGLVGGTNFKPSQFIITTLADVTLTA